MAASLYAERPWLKNYPPWVPSDLEIPRENLVEVLRSRARDMGANPSIHYFEQSLSFSELDRLSDHLCAALQALGLKKGDRVVFCLQNIPQFVIAQYAVWKGGGVVVPLNPMLKERELEALFQDSGAKMTIAMGSVYGSSLAPVAQKIKLGPIVTTNGLEFLKEGPLPRAVQEEKRKQYAEAHDFMDLLRKFSGTLPQNAPLNPEDPAYFTYTAGTDGPPKGALNTHGNIVFNALFYKTALRLGNEDVILGVSPFSHVTGQVAHLATGVYTGVPVILSFRFDAEETLRLIERWKATTTLASITVFLSLMHHPEIKKRDLSSFRKVLSGGAPVPPEAVERFEREFGIYIHNYYGLTETSSPSHFTPLGTRAPRDPETGVLAIGLPICNSLSRIVDLETGEREVPVGEIGEIVVKGPMVVPGYWNNPKETALAIRNGWLHTGDVGKMDADGWFYAVDRKKDLIIVSGYKVRPGEVEEVLCQHPAVQEALVVGVPDPYRGETVKAFVVVKDTFRNRVSSEELIEFCQSRMAVYKYPRLLEIIGEIPKRESRKFARRQPRETDGK